MLIYSRFLPSFLCLHYSDFNFLFLSLFPHVIRGGQGNIETGFPPVIEIFAVSVIATTLRTHLFEIENTFGAPFQKYKYVERFLSPAS